MDKNDGLNELVLPEGKSRQAFLVYLKIIFLPILIYAIFLLGFFNVIKFNTQLHTIIMMGAILFIALIFARHSAEFGCFVFEQRKDEFKKELKNYIMKSLLTIGKESKSNASFDEFVKKYSADVRDENYAAVGAGVFPMLGILGTFLSIAISMPNFSSTNTTALENEISSLLSGVGTAFYVSIYGIFLALWWIFFEKFGMNRFARLINRQKNATKLFFWSKEEIEQRYMQESLKNFEKVSTIFEHVGKREFFDELDKTVERKFQSFSNMLRVEEDAVKLSSEYIKHTMDMLFKAQRDQKDIVKVHAEILNVLHSFNLNLKDLQIRLSEHYARLQSASEDKIVKLERAINSFDEDINNFKNSLEDFSTKILDKQTLALDGFKAGLIDGMKAFRDVFDEESSSKDESSYIIEDLKKSLQEIDKDANVVLEKLEAKSNEDS
ncbi:MotA/TolQ/ExbB proton channel family protein [Campylobacter hyointestinalis]|uniref:MotA/TolQ/ExbB proton channel family protein n=1 Tax=Campylobacter hyointestinalis TaxID=198 RepID=UPI0011AC1913|nr:MotA/TolQ/ExbB proton channel family protein [Campylobacter hyointestinalis]TWO28400.1 MotA/TolQ/ExbB proton channel family protein [Campylobacter hyointestinalis]